LPACRPPFSPVDFSYLSHFSDSSLVGSLTQGLVGFCATAVPVIAMVFAFPFVSYDRHTFIPTSKPFNS
jgi:hypothetical protein